MDKIHLELSNEKQRSLMDGGDDLTMAFLISKTAFPVTPSEGSGIHYLLLVGNCDLCVCRGYVLMIDNRGWQTQYCPWCLAVEDDTTDTDHGANAAHAWMLLPRLGNLTMDCIRNRAGNPFLDLFTTDMQSRLEKLREQL